MAKAALPYRRVAERVRRRRLELGLSQRDLNAPGISYAYVSRIESGQRRPSLEALVALGRSLSVSALYLMSGDPHARCPVCHRNGGAPGAPDS
jgi:transcriptional regulator with XRE-family HTH domain